MRVELNNKARRKNTLRFPPLKLLSLFVGKLLLYTANTLGRRY